MLTARSKLIQEMKSRIKEIPEDEMNEASWGDEKGVLLTANEAKEIVKQISHSTVNRDGGRPVKGKLK